ncbi:MAG: hypothetical protein V1655_04210 [bacterium]
MDIDKVKLEKYKYGFSEDMSDRTEQECDELLTKMENPEIKARIKKLMESDERCRRVSACGRVK